MDTVSPSVRSRIMASVGTKNTGPEMLLRKALHGLGFRFRLHVRALPGSPDIVLSKFKAVIFVHGCFWHSHGCRLSTTPSTRKTFWREKFQANCRRDRQNIDRLLENHWRVIVVWQCSLKSGDMPISVAEKISRWLARKGSFLEIPRQIPPKTRSEESLHMTKKSTIAILHLNLHRQFFAAIVDGTKKTEYRAVSPYWKRRLEGRHYDVIQFRNGYATKAPVMVVEFLGLRHQTRGGQPQYALRLGRILKLQRWKAKE